MRLSIYQPDIYCQTIYVYQRNPTLYRLPRKSDVERKTSIYQFSNRTQQQFIRLQALVKWASKVSKVDKCTEVSMFLDKQIGLFIETADSLFSISKERLKNARLVRFSFKF